MKVLLLNGSPAQPSHTSATLDVVSKLFQEMSHDCETIDLINYGLGINDPVYHADAMESPSDKVKDFATKVKQANIVVMGTPLYHGSFSGLLKSALDNLDDDALLDKKILLVSNAAGIRVAQQASQQLSNVARTMYGTVHHRFIGTCKADFKQVGDSFQLVDEAILKRCEDLVKEILE